MLELLAGAAVAVVALAIILEPLVRGIRSEPAVTPGDFAEDAFTPLEESESPKIQALLALKEIEFDRATGKLSDEDYAQLKASYAQQALAAIEVEEREADDAAEAEDAAEALIRQARAQVRTCPECGPRPESEASFCSNCGRALV